MRCGLSDVVLQWYCGIKGHEFFGEVEEDYVQVCDLSTKMSPASLYYLPTDRMSFAVHSVSPTTCCFAGRL